MDKLRRFNEKGIQEFRNELSAVKSGVKSIIPKKLIFSDELTEAFEGNIKLKRKKFDSKKEMTKYLYEKVNVIHGLDKYYDIGLWSWLSVLFSLSFSLCLRYSIRTYRCHCD